MTTDKFGPGNPGYDSVITLGKTLKYEVKALQVGAQYVGTAAEAAALGFSGHAISAGIVGYQAYHGDYDGAAKTAIGAATGAYAGGAAANAAKAAGYGILERSAVGAVAGAGVGALTVGAYEFLKGLLKTNPSAIDHFTRIAAPDYPHVSKKAINDLLAEHAERMKGLSPEALARRAASGETALESIRHDLERLENLASRPGHLDPSHDPLDLGSQPHSAPKPGFNVTSPTGYSSRGVDAPEGPEAFGGGNDHDPGDNRANGPTGGHVPGSQHPGNTNGTGHSGSHGGRGGFTPSAGGGHGDTSSFGGNSGRDTPPGDVSTHDPYHNGTGAQPVVFDLDGNGIGKTTIFIGAGDDRLLQRAQQGSGDVI